MFNKWNGVLRRLSTIPAPAVLFVLALGLFLWGAYVVSPFFQPGPAISVAFGNNRTAEYLFGFVYIAIGLLRMAGVAIGSKTILFAAPYALMMGYLFLAILEVDVVGWYPLTWVPLLICAIIGGICRLALLLERVTPDE
jgi:hypothetical protein